MPDPNLFSDGDIIVCYGRGEAHRQNTSPPQSIALTTRFSHGWSGVSDARRRHRHVRFQGAKRKTYARIELSGFDPHNGLWPTER
jgi:hypothetical protein